MSGQLILIPLLEEEQRDPIEEAIWQALPEGVPFDDLIVALTSVLLSVTVMARLEEVYLGTYRRPDLERVN